MARRYGRNQKRRAREEIASLYAVINFHIQTEGMWRDKAQAAERQLANAESAAFERFVRDASRYEMLCARAVEEIARMAGESLMPFAEKLMRHANKHRPMLRFSATPYAADSFVRRIDVEWPSARFSMNVMAWPPSAK